MDSVNKTTITKYIDLYKNAHSKIYEILVDSFQLSDVDELLDVLHVGCNTMTDGYCRGIWSAGKIYGEESIDIICKNDCKFWNLCIQNPANHNEANAYYLLTQIWAELIKIKKSKEITEESKILINGLMSKLKDIQIQTNEFDKIVEKW